jgi:hypothetical protein
MSKNLFTLPILLLTLAGSAMGYYFGVTNQRSKAISVRVSTQEVAQQNKIALPVAQTEATGTNQTVKTTPSPVKKATPIKPAVVAKPKTPVTTTPAKVVTPKATPAPVVAAPAPTPTTAAS